MQLINVISIAMIILVVIVIIVSIIVDNDSINNSLLGEDYRAEGRNGLGAAWSPLHVAHFQLGSPPTGLNSNCIPS